jgi:hypothetical protein
VHGRIWRVTFHGSADTPVAAAPAPTVVATSSGEPSPPEGTHPEAAGSVLPRCQFPPWEQPKMRSTWATAFFMA